MGDRARSMDDRTGAPGDGPLAGDRIRGRIAIRPCFINPRTTPAEVEGLVDTVLRFGDEIAAERR